MGKKGSSLFGQIAKSMISGSYDKSMSSSIKKKRKKQNSTTYLPKWLYHFKFLPVMRLHILPSMSCFSIPDLDHSSRPVMVTHCGFQFHFPYGTGRGTSFSYSYFSLHILFGEMSVKAFNQIPFVNVFFSLPSSLILDSGLKQEKEYVKAVYGHPAYLTYMQSAS